MAHIFVRLSPQEWITQHLLAEFRRAGFSVVPEPNDDAASVSVHVRQLFVEPRVGFSAIDVAGIAITHVEVMIPHSQRWFSREFVGSQVSSELFVFDSIPEKNLVDSAESCFRQVVEGVYQLLSDHTGEL